MEINWNEIESTLNDGGRIRTSQMAKELGLKTAEFRSALIERFGDNIEFRRGRNGGVYLREGATLSAV